MPLLRDWTDSLTVDSLDAHGERFFTRLLMKVDDYGRTHAEPRLLKSRLFPLKTDIRETDISRWLAECQKAGLLRFYVDAKGRTILEVFKFGQRKKFMKSEYDPPEDQAFLPLPANGCKSKKILSRGNEVEIEVEEKGKQAAPEPPLKKCSNTITLQTASPLHAESHRKQKRTLWQLLKDEAEINTRLKSEQERTKPDADMVEALKNERRLVRDEIKSLNPKKP